MNKEQYLDMVREMPCLICLQTPAGTAHHAYGPSMTARGFSKSMNSKTSDWLAIPLCPAHHQHGPDAVHVIGVRAFEKKFGDQAEMIDGLSEVLDIDLWGLAAEDMPSKLWRNNV